MNRFISEQCIDTNSLSFSRHLKQIQAPLEMPILGLAKRTIDIVFSSIILITLFPLYVIVAIAIKLDSPGPAVLGQKRIGKDGTPITIYKFRTMKSSTIAYDYSPTNSKDKRVTKIGRFLREAGIDELPQFLNVLRGEMSIVGPRPEMEFIVKSYNDLERTRLLVKPGITGLWQIKASRKRLIHEDIQFDLIYLRNFSILLDISIMTETAWLMIRKMLTAKF